MPGEDMYGVKNMNADTYNKKFKPWYDGADVEVPLGAQYKRWYDADTYDTKYARPQGPWNFK